MEQNSIHYILISLDLFAALILLLILLSSALGKEKNALLKIYKGMAGACAFALLMEAVSAMLFFSDWQYVNLTRTIINNFAIIGGYGLSFNYACYVANMVGAKRKLCRYMLTGLRIVGAVAAVVLVVGGGFELFFKFVNGATTIKLPVQDGVIALMEEFVEAGSEDVQGGGQGDTQGDGHGVGRGCCKCPRWCFFCKYLCFQGACLCWIVLVILLLIVLAIARYIYKKLKGKKECDDEQEENTQP